MITPGTLIRVGDRLVYEVLAGVPEGIVLEPGEQVALARRTGVRVIVVPNRMAPPQTTRRVSLFDVTTEVNGKAIVGRRGRLITATARVPYDSVR